MGGLLLALAWGVLVARTGVALAGRFAGADRAAAGVALLLGVGALVVRGWREVRAPVVRVGPAGVLFGAAVLHVVAERYVGAETIASVLLVAGTYGLAGFFLAPERWRRGLLVALAVAALLPVGEQAELYAGFPARVMAARFAEHALALLGVRAVSAETVLILERGLADVAAPCSGLRSLWTGALLFLGATAIEDRRPGLAWLAAGAAFALTLVAANALRVTALIALIDAPRLASALHVPLGLAFFAGACALGWRLLALAPAHVASPTCAPPPRQPVDLTAGPRLALAPAHVAPPTCAPPPRQPVHLTAGPRLALAPAHVAPPAVAPSRVAAPSVVGAALVMALLALAARPREEAARPPNPATKLLPGATRVALDPAEAALGASATKMAFTVAGRPASALLVAGDRWDVHHPPELCLAGLGLALDGARDVTLAPGFVVRVLSLEHGTKSAVYWFQSRTARTPHLIERVWADVTGPHERWVMVHALFDAPPDPGAMRETIEALAALAEVP